MKKRFGFLLLRNKTILSYLRYVSIPFFLLCFLSLVFFATYYQVSWYIFRNNKVDILTNDLHDIALYFRRYDRELSDIVLWLDMVVQSYNRWENIFITHGDTIEEILVYMQNNRDYLSRVWFASYQYLVDTVIWALDYKDDIYDLFGKNWERNYLVILQNTAEKRPNWWFFWSFAFVSWNNWFLQDFTIIDAYYPNWIAPDIMLQAPDRSRWFIPDTLIWFVAANKFWFTNIDWRNIKNLYNHIFNNPSVYDKRQDVIEKELFEKTFNKTVNGVVFVRSDMLTLLLPWLQEKLRERQFVNANTDIIRKKEAVDQWVAVNFSNKKETYIDEVSTYFRMHQWTLFRNMLVNFQDIVKNHYLNVYVDTDTTNLQNTWLLSYLETNWFMTKYSPNVIYLRDSNDSFSKSDSFVAKNVSLYNASDQLLYSCKCDIMPVWILSPWSYHLRITYYFDVPQSYVDFIVWLEQKYNIRMTDREKWILALQPARHYITWREKRRWTRATVYLPPNAKIIDTIWDIEKSENFSANFAQWVYYEMSTIKNQSEQWMRIYFTIPNE